LHFSKSKLRLIDRYLFLVLLIPLAFIIYPLTKPGIVVNEDFLAEGIDNSWTWIDKGSHASFDSIQRLPTTALWHIMVSLGFNYELIGKIMVVSGFLLASFCFYFGFYLLFRNRVNSSNIRLKAVSIIGSLFYAYNTWSFIRISHWYLWISYAIMPLFVVSVVYCLNEPRRWRYIISTVLIWSFASSTPFMVIVYSIIFISIFIFFILRNRAKRQIFNQIGIPFFTIIFLYIAVNLYWIYPYYSSIQDSSFELGPYYILTKEIGEVLSNDNNLLNTFRLVGDWTDLQLVEPTQISPIYPLWLFASFAVPIVAFSSFLYTRNNRFGLIFLFASIIGILLAMGTLSPTSYYELIFLIPFGWIFRDPNKWSFLIAFGYSFLISIAVLKFMDLNLGRFGPRKSFVACCFSLVLLFSIGLTSYPVYVTTFGEEGRMSPILIPPEFGKLNTYLSNISDSKIFYLPYPAASTNWSNGHTVGNLYQQLSSKSSIDVGNPTLSNPAVRNYYNYFVKNVIQNSSANIDNLIYPFGTEYLVFHDDSPSHTQNSALLSSIYENDGMSNIQNIGFFKIFRLNSKNENGSVHLEPFNIINKNTQVVQGLDKVALLNKLPSFSSLNTSLSFLDQAIAPDKKNHVEDSDNLILQKNAYDFVLSFLDEEHTIEPYTYTHRYDPSKVWSRASTLDSLHGEFHPVLEDQLGIENWDFDYGKGIVMTKEAGAKISIPIKIDNTTDYDIYLRYLNNQRGGELKVYLDNKTIGKIETGNRISNSFVWDSIISKVNITGGSHNLTLENVFGFNAVNMFAILPSSESTKLFENAYSLANKTRNIYLLDAQSDFTRVGGTENGSIYHLFDLDDKKGMAKNFTWNATGSMSVPEEVDHISLGIRTKGSPFGNVTYNISNLNIVPYGEPSNFSESKVNISKFAWHPNNNDILSASPVDHTKLLTEVKKSDLENWGIVSSELIPLGDDKYYKYEMKITTSDVNQLHSKIRYYDLDRKLLKDEFIFTGIDGTFNREFAGSLIPPMGTKYATIEFLSLPNPETRSHYLIDFQKLEPISSDSKFNNDLDLFRNFSPSVQTVSILRDEHGKPISLGTELAPDFFNRSALLETQPFPIKGNSTYNFTAFIKSNNTSSLNLYASFFKNPKPETGQYFGQRNVNVNNGFNFTDYLRAFDMQSHASSNKNLDNKNFVALAPHSKLYTNVDVLTKSNYTLALRADHCGSCDPLSVSIQNKDGKFVLDHSEPIVSLEEYNSTSDSPSSWFYFRNFSLLPGNYDMQIYSESHRQLDLVMLYSSGDDKFNRSNELENVENLFTQSFDPAVIKGYKKIDPTKYVVSITNATRPYLLSFAESYDPLWTAYLYKNNGVTEIHSNPSYSITNSFQINELGEYELIVEYQPQKWIIYGGLIGTVLLTIFIITFTIIKKYIITKKLNCKVHPHEENNKP
jgi:hypothetical protein